METNSDCRPTTCSRMIFASMVRRAGALELPLSDGRLESITEAPVHKFARSLHKNASSVNGRVARPRDFGRPAPVSCAACRWKPSR
jgi:hypothetical protein